MWNKQKKREAKMDYILANKISLRKNVAIIVACSVTVINSVARASEPMIPRDPGTRFRECPGCPEMIVIPPGSFTMGSPQSEKERRAGEGPQHNVTISRAFAVGVYHVTRGEYTAFVRATHRPSGGGCFAWDGKQVAKFAAMNWRSPGFQQTDRDPVVCVSWEDAKAYVQWLNDGLRRRQHGAPTSSTGPYRLLTEGEWEYAARAGTTTRYFWGDDPKATCRYANSLDVRAIPKILGSAPTKKVEDVSCDDDGYVFTSPTGRLAPNAFGLYDIFGDAWQWTEDCWHDDYTAAPADSSAWTTGECSLRVIRGGSWGNPPQLLRSAYRSKYPTDYSDNYAGFRVARNLD